jgi:hypothetical protein
MNEKIQERLLRHYNTIIDQYGADSVLGVFLYGSQNYKCDLATSDVDTKGIIIPDLYHLAIDRHEVKHIDIEGEVCECMTIMHMVANWKKQNPNFVEIMFTDYYILNPKYAQIWTPFINTWREKIARYDVRCGIKSICGQALNTIRQNPYDGKKIGNAYRLLSFVEHYEAGDCYQNCLIPECASLVKQYKAGIMPVSKTVAEQLTIEFKRHMDEADNFPTKDKSLQPFLDNFIIELLQKRIMG